MNRNLSRNIYPDLSRLDKTKLVADWGIALNNIKVCQPNWPGENCGSCEKCIRTMLGLLSLGVLEKTRSFPENDVSETMISNIKMKRQTHPEEFAMTWNTH